MCPNCNKESYCDCDNCIKRPLPEGGKYYIVEELEFYHATIECPYCGFKADYGVWEDYEYEQLMKKNGTNSLYELSQNRKK